MRFAITLVLTLSSVTEARRLPWSETISARESSSSESSAKYLTQTALRYRVDRLDYECRAARGYFWASYWQMTCNRSGFTHTCSATATCQCREPRPSSR